MSTSVEIAKPSKPWKPSLQERFIDFSLVATAFLSSFLIVEFTEMKGK